MTSFEQFHSVALLNLEKLSAADPLTRDFTQTFMGGEDAHARKAVLQACANAPCEVQRRIEAEFFGNGPIEGLLDSDCTEIIVNGRDSIWFEQGGVLHRHDDVFHSPLSYRNFLSRLCREASMIATLDCPFADGRWRDMRVHLIIPPASGDEAVLTLRRHPKIRGPFQSSAKRAGRPRRNSHRSPALSKRNLIFSSSAERAREKLRS